ARSPETAAAKPPGVRKPLRQSRPESGNRCGKAARSPETAAAKPPKNAKRRRPGGGEAPPFNHENPQEEERASDPAGPCGPGIGCGGLREEERDRRASNAPGRRRGAPKLLGLCGPGIGCGGLREEERDRRASNAPGRRRGAPKLLGPSGPGMRVRRSQGGGERPPRIERPREEERGSEALEALRPRYLFSAAASGRRREAAAGPLRLREEERAGGYSKSYAS
ncbi:hypothetical protein, partial [Salipiger marinus]|uniref:hypothetical protein n=1 Tax=Salipiger marinus TaxID=555512 RepID=UPI00405825DB